MIYFCADDYGISPSANSRIEYCLKNGILNKISVLPNGQTTDFKDRLSKGNPALSLHINLIEGRPLSNPDDVGLLISDTGYFKYTFVGLFLLSLSPKRKEFKKQLYKEIKSQIEFWKSAVGENSSISIDSHQHTHMIPLVFKTLMNVIEDENLNVETIRIPNEPILPYIFTFPMCFKYGLAGLIKQLLLKILAFVNRNRLKNTKIQTPLFLGVLFTGRMSEKKIKKLLPHYLKIAEKSGKNIEICLHPGYMESGEKLIEGSRQSFNKFYFSQNRKIEFDTLINFKF